MAGFSVVNTGALVRMLSHQAPWASSLPLPLMSRCCFSGRRLVEHEAERASRRLLLMLGAAPSPSTRLGAWVLGAIGAIVSGLDQIVAENRRTPVLPASSILLLHRRLALLAEVGIVERAGPEFFQ